MLYLGGHYANLDSDLAALSAANTVITSLDLKPANGAYGAAGIQVNEGGIFDLKHEIVPPDQVPMVVAEDGAQSRVITAVSFDVSGQTNLLSYGWQDVGGEVYQTDVVSVAAEGVATAATNLAGQGYIITAFGGDATHGFLLVGTKVEGDTVPRPIFVATPSNTPFSKGAVAGYAPVGHVSYVTNENSQAYAVIYEK